MSAATKASTNEAIISDILGRAPDVELSSEADGWRLCRWRQFVGTYKSGLRDHGAGVAIDWLVGGR